MSWRFSSPRREDFDTDEEYEVALENYDAAEDLYMEAYLEDYFDRKYDR